MNKNVVYSTELPERVRGAFQFYRTTYGKSPILRRRAFLSFADQCDHYHYPVLETAMKLLNE